MRLLGLFIVGVLLCAAQTAAATVVILPPDTQQSTLQTWGAPRPVMEPRDDPYTGGPIALADGVFFSSTNPRSMLGFTGTANFAGNGSWQNSAMPMSGVNATQGAMSFVFATPVSAIIAQANWASAAAAPGEPPVTISIYNDADQLLETLVVTDGKVDFAKGGSFIGFIRPNAEIARITFSNGFLGARDFFSRYTSNYMGDGFDGGGPPSSSPPIDGPGGGPSGGPLGPSQPGAVPEPSTWALMLFGFGATGTLLRRSRGRMGVA